MSEIVDLERRRLQKEIDTLLGPGYQLCPRPSTRWKNAFTVFLTSSCYGRNRQLKFLYRILHRSKLQRPISYDEMTDMLIEYLQMHAPYLEKKRGISMNFDYDKEADEEEFQRMLGHQDKNQGGLPAPKNKAKNVR